MALGNFVVSGRQGLQGSGLKFTRLGIWGDMSRGIRFRTLVQGLIPNPKRM